MEMDLQMIMNIAMIVILSLVATLVVLLLVGRKRERADDGVERIADLIRQATDTQRDEIVRQLETNSTHQFARFDVIQNSLQGALQANREEVGGQLTRINESIAGSLQANRVEMSDQSKANRDEVSTQLGRINATIEMQMKALQESNEKRLEQMQGIVDEKLQQTLETRLAKSFELVSKQLESVQLGLGEMKSLASDAKSLKNALTNVKQRGTYGEVRLDWILSDILAPHQYEAQVAIDGRTRVDFAVKLPGNGVEPVLLPIDSKFPMDSYSRLLEAEDKASINAARNELTKSIKDFAESISKSYISPPKTTNFAIMFLPTEGLYAEVVQNVTLFEEIREKFSITVVGPVTLSAYLSSLQMGFKTLAIEQRSQEVWEILRGVQSEFATFAKALEKAQSQIQTVDKTLTSIRGTRMNAMHRKLRGVGELEDTAMQLPFDEDIENE